MGLEIGALGRPMPVHGGMTVHYVDAHPADVLRRLYPETSNQRLVDPTIVDDATHLATVGDGTYDFLIAAHVLEHLTNPIRAIESWCRVLRPCGLLYLVLPDRRFTFDWQRPRTLLAHLILDYEAPSPERDFEHYLEYAVLVNRARTPDALAEARRLHDARWSIHFHVFEPADLVALVEWFSASVRPVEVVAGPLQNVGADEFHLLLTVPSRRQAAPAATEA